jgi:hypothetical protein
MLLVASYESETWFLTLSGVRRLRLSENRVLRRICGPKKEEVIESGEDLRNEELYDLYSSQT